MHVGVGLGGEALGWVGEIFGTLGAGWKSWCVTMMGLRRGGCELW